MLGGVFGGLQFGVPWQWDWMRSSSKWVWVEKRALRTKFCVPRSLEITKTRRALKSRLSRSNQWGRKTRKVWRNHKNKTKWRKSFKEWVIDGTTGAERPNKLRTDNWSFELVTWRELGTLTRTVLVKWQGWKLDENGLKNKLIKNEEWMRSETLKSYV